MSAQTTSGQLDQKHHSSIGLQDKNFIKVKFSEITFGTLDQKWSFSMPVFTGRVFATIPETPPALTEVFQTK